MEKITGIYKITNNHNGKKYIGQSTNVYTRWYNEKNGDCNEYLLRSFGKYGIENFSFEILIIINKIDKYAKQLLDFYEVYFICYYNTNNRKNGYNISPGGVGTLSEETRIKLIKSHTGRKHSEETKQKISKSNTGRKHSEETKQKISKQKKEYYIKVKKFNLLAPMVRSDEYKQKQINAWLLRKKRDGNKLYFERNKEYSQKLVDAWVLRKENEELNLKYKEKRQEIIKKNPNMKKRKEIICLETGKIYTSLSEASTITGINVGSISNSINKKQKTAGNLNGVPLHWAIAPKKQ